MTTLTIRLTHEQKRMLKMKAAFHGKTVTDFVLDNTGVKNKGTMHEAVKDLKKGRHDEFDSLEDLFADWEKAITETSNEY